MQHIIIAYRSVPEGHIGASLPSDVIKSMFGASTSSSSLSHVIEVRGASSSASNNGNTNNNSIIAFLSVSAISSSGGSRSRRGGDGDGRGGGRALEIDPVVGEAMSLAEGQEVIIAALHTVQTCSRVFVEPATINDSEIAEENATYLEMMMLNLARVVFVDQRIPVPLPSGTRVHLRVTSVTVGGGDAELPKKGECALLAPGCEMCIATKRRQQQKTDGDDDSERRRNKSTSGVLRLLLDFSVTPSAILGREEEEASPSSSSSVALVVSPFTASALGWNDQQQVAMLDLAWWSEALSLKSSKPKLPLPASPKTQRQRGGSPGDDGGALSSPLLQQQQQQHDDIVSDPALLRKSLKISVRVQQPPSSSSSFVMLAPFCAVVIAPRGAGSNNNNSNNSTSNNNLLNSPFVKREGPTCAFCWPLVEGTQQQAGGGGSIRSAADVLLSSTAANSSAASSSSSSSSQQQPIRLVGSIPPSLAQLKRVHGAEGMNKLFNLVCGGDPDGVVVPATRAATTAVTSSSSSSSSSPPTHCRSPRILLTGNRGCGKSAVAVRCAMDSGRHVVVVECATARKDFPKRLSEALLECVACGPACLVLEDLENVVARERDLAGGPAAASAPEASLQALNALENLLLHASSAVVPVWCSSNDFSSDAATKPTVSYCQQHPRMLLDDIAIIATAQNVEMLHPQIQRHSSSPFGFAFEHRVALPNLAARTALIDQLFFGLTTNNKNIPEDNNNDHRSLLVGKLAAETEHFAPSDLLLLLRTAQREENNSHDGAVPDVSDDECLIIKKALTLATHRHVVPLALASVNFLNKNSGGGGGNDSANKKLSWGSVGGLGRARGVLKECIVLPCRHPEIFEKLPLKSRSGVLLYGPSGCGKSHLVACLAEAENLNCIVVNGPEILDKYIGASEQKIRDVFERAQAAAPCVLFLDEFDSIAPQRGHDNTGVTDRVVNQLLCYLDGVEARSKVYVVAASSRPDLIDVALLRPGRLDRHVMCGFPTAEERREILASHVRHGLPNGEAVLAALDLDMLASDDRTANWTGADLAALVTSAGVAYAKRAALAAEEEEARRKQQKNANDDDDYDGNEKKSVVATRCIKTTRADGSVVERVVAVSSEEKRLEETRRAVDSSPSAAIVSRNLAGASSLMKRFQLAELHKRTSQLQLSIRQQKRGADDGKEKQSSSRQRHHDVTAADDAAVVHVTAEDFDAALRSTRPSCSERDVLRMERQYSNFQNRGKRQQPTTTDQQQGTNNRPGSRVSMA